MAAHRAVSKCDCCSPDPPKIPKKGYLNYLDFRIGLHAGHTHVRAKSSQVRGGVCFDNGWKKTFQIPPDRCRFNEIQRTICFLPRTFRSRCRFGLGRRFFYSYSADNEMRVKRVTDTRVERSKVSGMPKSVCIHELSCFSWLKKNPSRL